MIQDQEKLLESGLKTVAEINENRQKHIDRFVKAYLSVKAPEGFDLNWLMDNVTLCCSQVIHRGQAIDKYWLELNPNSRRR